MTEKEWLESEYPLDLLRYLRRKRRSVPSPRKFRLFACACVSHVGRFLRDRWLVDALALAERYADGLADRKEMRSARRAASAACQEAEHVSADVAKEVSWPESCTAWAAHILTAVPRAVQGEQRLSMRVAKDTAYNSTQAIGYAEREAAESVRARGEEMGYQCRLLRDIVGNPFRPTVIDPRWRSADAVGLARGIYEDRAFDRLPLLADALMDAGCADETVVAHCRLEGPHVRGCWVTDAVLGKE